MSPLNSNDISGYVRLQQALGEPVYFTYKTQSRGAKSRTLTVYDLGNTGIIDPSIGFVYTFDRIQAVGKPVESIPAKPEPHYVVYVLEVDQDPMTVYVGQTWHSREHSLAQHAEHGRLTAQSIKHAQHLELRPDLYKGYEPVATQDESLQQEDMLAKELRDRGFTVLGGH